MITDPVMFIKSKLNHMIISTSLVGLIFILLGVAIIFMPEIVQYLFVVGFVLIGLLMFVVALRLSHIKDMISNLDIFKR